MVDGVTWRDYIDRIFEEKERTLLARLDASQRALDAATRALDLRLEAMNEFRTQITNERALYVRREMLDSRAGAIEDRVRALESTGSNLAGRFWALGIAVGLLTTIFNVALSFVLRLWFK